MRQSAGQDASPHGARRDAAHSRHEVRVLAPYRLDLTASVLRRLSTNLIDRLSPRGEYRRVFADAGTPLFVQVTQRQPDTLIVELEGEASAHPPALALVSRMLGVQRDVAPFSRAAAQLPWLAPLAHQMRGVKPPRYPTLWEACVNAIVFQQVSLFAASAIMQRLLIALAPTFPRDGGICYAFPSAERVTRAPDTLLRTLGLSAGKIGALRGAAEAIAAGSLSDAILEARSSPDAADLLRQIKGIGPWTAAVILLRGLGRLDVFPMNDSSVARNLALVAGPVELDVPASLDILGQQRGMLYYNLLLARLSTRGEVGKPSVAPVSGC
jgi:DNA-3-methyladenine glycosylase II